MKKRMFAMLLALVMIVSMLPLAAFALNENDDCPYGTNGQHDWNDQGKCENYTGSFMNRRYCNAQCTHAAGFDSNNRCNTCDRRCTHTSNSGNSRFNNGVCSNCNYQCQHKNSSGQSAVQKGTCSICKMKVNTHDHRYDPAKGTGVCEVDGCNEPCKHPAKDGSAWADGKCKTCGVACQHDDYDNTGKCENCKIQCEHLVHDQNAKCVECKNTVEHESVALPDTDPTCGADGVNGGTKCSVCNKILTQPTTNTNRPEHNYERVGVSKEATCSQGGKDLYRCSACGDEEERDTAATNEHSWKYVRPQEGSTLNCDNAGVGVYECRNCTEVSAQHTPKLGHDLKVKEVIYEATCTNRSVTTYVCDREGCGFSPTVVGDPNGHTPVAMDAVDPTCTATGLTAGEKCSVCGEVLKQQEEIRKAEHDWKEYKEKAATCTKDGNSAYQQCRVCKTTQNKVVYPAGHKFVDGSKICDVCGERDITCQHPNGKITTTKSTCTVPGTKTFDCPDCKYHFEETLALAKHKEEDKSYPATCTSTGLTHKICKVCGVDIVPATIIPVASHTNVKGKCSVCGATLCLHPHVTTKITPSTCTVQGTKKETCTDCGKVMKTSLPLAPHTHVNGICQNCGHLDSNRITVDYNDFFIVG